MKIKNQKDLAVMYARVAPHRAAMLKFVIEGCDNLASVSARGRDMLALRYHPGRRRELAAVLEDVCGQETENGDGPGL